ncbi:GNAT family N-acetyltransferase [Jatrophihabitans sp.]|jgi:ribosomal protein S18 acetylase RimI-like enzyme|uniref:GNAT family N-acetyltransferase n=1 Tax=Jatrophihabitans sp. TaxID=1932789 RepID=UPI002F111BDF
MARRLSKYRGAALLTGLIVLGWLWDLALGGGRAHAAAWFGAVIVVGGVSLLATRGAADPEPPPATAPRPAGQIVIEPATAQDLPRLIEVEVAADTLFEVAGYGSTPGPASLDELASARLLLVARRLPSGQPPDPSAEQPPAPSAEQPPDHPVEQPPDHPVEQPPDPPVGYIRLELIDGQPHIEGLSVRPREMRRGIGTALVNAACQWATEQGYREITLCTFGDVPWNGPFYARLGFTEIPAPSPALRALRQREVRLGLDGMGRRCVMRRSLDRTGGSVSPADLPIN